MFRLFGGPHIKDYTFLGVYFGVSLFWETTIGCLGFMGHGIHRGEMAEDFGFEIYGVFRVYGGWDS